MDFGGEDTNLLIDDGIKTDLDNNDQEMSMDLKSVNNETEHENPEQMLEDLQNPMSVAPSSEYSHPPATPAYSEAPPTPYSMMEDSTIDDEPFSPPPRPPRVDTADSIMDRFEDFKLLDYTFLQPVVKSNHIASDKAKTIF